MIGFQEILDWQIFTLSGTPVTVGTLATALLVVIVAIVTSHVLQGILGRGMKKGQFGEGTASVLQRLVHYTVMLVGIGIALDTIGINLSTLFAAGAIFAIGLGFAMQNIAQNFVAGVILLVERSIKPGDVLGIEGLVVRVEHSPALATRRN